MLEYVISFFVMIIVFGGMMTALVFSKYKQKPSSCCGGGHCVTGTDSQHEEGHSCYNSKLEFVKAYPEEK